jgi:predicted Zn-dependent protease
MWSRLRLIDRLQGQQALRLYVRDRADIADTAFDHELYVLLREFDSKQRDADLAGLSELWLPTLAAKPQLQRQVWMLHIPALRSTGRNQEALDAIHNMLAVFPNSGDAWEQLAEQAELMEDTFAAERALAHIATAEPEGSPRWLDVSLHRLQLLAAAQTPDARACPLEATIRVYNHRLSEEQQQDLAVLSRDMACSMQEE